MSGAVTLVVDALSWLLLSAGAVFCVLGGLGIVRFPDFYTRVHAAGLTDTLGAGLILIGLAFQSHEPQVTIKLALVLLFLVITSPTATHALVKAAHGYDVRLDIAIPDHPLEPGEDPFETSPAPSEEGASPSSRDRAQREDDEPIEREEEDAPAG